MKAVKITPGTDPIEFDYEDFDELRKVVGGYISPINLALPSGEYLAMLVDEDGYSKNLAPNLIASVIAQHHAPKPYISYQLLGTAVITGPIDYGSETNWATRDFTLEDYKELIK